MAGATDDQGFTAARGHPCGPFAPAAFTNDLQYGCGVSHLAYLTVIVDRKHLCPFALWTAFPSSPVGRDPE
jgi:hypothetical protein